jgi:hypothetical protein
MHRKMSLIQRKTVPKFRVRHFSVHAVQLTDLYWFSLNSGTRTEVWRECQSSCVEVWHD